MKRRVVVTGLGVVSPVGNAPQDFFAGLLAGVSGIRRLQAPAHAVAGVVAFDPAAHFTKLQLTGLDRFSQFGLVAARQALDEARLSDADFASTRTGVYFGSGLGGANALETGYRAFLDPAQGRVPPLTVIATMANAAAAHISLRYGIRGPSLTYSIACASSAVALGEAYRAIRDGYVDVAIAGGAEAMITPVTIGAWDEMKVLAKADPEHPERSCRPFARNRSGLVLGEGAGVVILETLERAAARGCAIHAEMAGYAMTSDASHITKPAAEGQAAAMRLALEDSGLAASAIGYINAHGTATQAGDIAETTSIKQVFGKHAYNIPVSSTKALLGHLMGAAGAVEMIASILALQTGSIPPTCHLAEPDPVCDLDYVPSGARHGIDLKAVMSNSFAFGGTNAVLIAKRYP